MASTSPRRKPAVKQATCTYCAQVVEVARRAMSVFCPHCKKRLILEDYKIRSYYAVREFFTCGDIVVERRGHVVAPIKVGNLTVRGKVHGHVTARGRVSICKAGWFKGELEAPTLRVEGGAVVDGFLRIGVTPQGAGPESAEGGRRSASPPNR